MVKQPLHASKIKELQAQENVDNTWQSLESELSTTGMSGTVGVDWRDIDDYHFRISFSRLNEHEARALIEAAKAIRTDGPKKGDALGPYVIESVSNGMAFYRNGALHGVPISDVVPDGKPGYWIIKPE